MHKSLLMVGAAQAMFFAVLLFKKRPGTKADFVLALWLISLCIHLVIFYLILHYPVRYYFLGFIDATLLPMSGIWMFIYTKTLTTPTGKFNYKWILHFFSLLPANFTLIPFYISGKEKQIQFIRNLSGFNELLILGVITNFIVFSAYVAASYFELKRHKKRIRFTFSYDHQIDLNWLINLVYALMLMGILVVALVPFLISNRYYFLEIDLYLYLLQVVFIFILGYWGFNQGKIFQYSNQLPQEKNKDEEIKGNLQFEDKLARELHTFMVSNKPYLNSKLTLYDLASSLNWSSHNLSNHLNKFQNINFYEFINNYRVQEVKRKLKEDHNKFTILAIAFDCGFNSKASFNRIFKDATGFTPTEYINNSLNSKERA